MRKKRKKKTDMVQKYKTLVITPEAFRMRWQQGNRRGTGRAPQMEPSSWRNQAR